MPSGVRKAVLGKCAPILLTGFFGKLAAFNLVNLKLIFYQKSWFFFLNLFFKVIPVDF